MKKFWATLIFFCAMILASTTHAENWPYVTFNPYGMWYIDADSVAIDKNVDGEFIFHTLVKKEPPSNAKQQSNRENLKYTIYCEEFRIYGNVRQVRVTRTTNYTQDGTAYDDEDDVFDWDVMPPNSVAELLFDATYQLLIHD